MPTCPACGFVAYNDPKVAAGVIIEHTGRIALLQRAGEPARGRWTFPGGYVDRGEPVPVAAAREAREEVGLQVRVGALVGVYSSQGDPVVLIVYRGEVAGGQFRPGPEAEQVGWLLPGELPWEELAFPSTVAAFTDYLKGAPAQT